jgi:hypothetical protein
MKTFVARAAALLLGCCSLTCATAAAAKSAAITLQSVTPIGPNIGTVVYSPGGTTVFTIAPSSGSVTRTSGSGVRVTSNNATTALVTLTCTGGNNVSDCQASTTESVTITATGTPGGMAGALTNFTVAPGPVPVTLVVPPTGTSSVTFTVGGIPQNGTGSFYVGMDFPITGTAGVTGPASSSFLVTVGKGGHATTGSGTAVATVIRPIALAELTSLKFGMIARPRSGNGTVTLDPATGSVSTTGVGTGVFGSPASAAASYTVSGEGGQTFSINVPPFSLNGPGGGTLLVTPSSSPSGAGALGGSVGGSGSTTIYVGGSFPISDTTPLGNYSGTLSITVQYN